ncbi:MAG: GNAT family N-acetyltransferase [Gammaproteobacteria bacterium]|nr:GNAT family N-acetyltransferase [Gammaproteobacteria bacterium]
MKFICYSNWSELPESVNQFFEQSAKRNMFFARPWFETLVSTTLNSEQSMLLACVIENDSFQAILPLIKNNNGNWEALSHPYGSEFSILINHINKKDEVITCLAQGLSQLSFKSISIKPFDKDDQNIINLKQSFELNGIVCHQGFRFYNWTCELKDLNFSVYMSKRPSKVRNTIARKDRKLKREHGYNIKLFINDMLEQAMDDYYKVIQSSWKAKEQYLELMNELVNRFAKEGCLRLAIMYVDEKPIAAQLWFVVHRKASIFRLAYNEKWKKYSPGSILTKFLMEYVIETDKVDELDFLTGNEQYKQDWMTMRKERWEMVCVKTTKPTSKVKQIIANLKRLLKNR